MRVAVIKQSECVGKWCTACAEACPNQAIDASGDIAFVDVNACDGCGICLDECPNWAITLEETADA
ncbi:MAG: 4Fe-4S binding protein [Chloroflexi bacterium]|nr:4Fe-4S binding protein [Chloroflexota bacterium]MCL5075283.1 4Fe-4S binding protein [Chloroflexota bacterium]